MSFRTYYEYFKTGGGYVFTLFVFGLLALAEVCMKNMCFTYITIMMIRLTVFLLIGGLLTGTFNNS